MQTITIISAVALVTGIGAVLWLLHGWDARMSGDEPCSDWDGDER